MAKTTDEILLETVRRIEDNQASQDRDMEKDRQDLQNLTIRLETVESELAQLRKAVNISSDKVKERIQEAIQPITEATDTLTSQIKKSKTVIFGEPKKNWWIRLIDKWS